MPFTFIHTADIHIGRAFERTIGKGDASAGLRDARLSAIDTLAELARTNGAEHILVAGDVFHSQNLKLQTIRKAIARMTSKMGVTWHLLPGNHDHLHPGGIWSVFCKDIGANTNVVVHTERAVYELESGVQVLTCPCRTKFPAEDPTNWLNEAPNDTDAIRIGLAHGATIDFDRDDATRAVIDPKRAEKAGLDYLALGDWHGTGEAGPRAWYSGAPEQDNWKNNDAGNALVVTIDGPRSQGGAPPKIDVHRTGKYTWQRMAIDVTDTEINAALAAAVPDTPSKPFLLLSATLTGVLSLEAQAELDDALERWADELHYLRTDDSGLVISIAGDDSGFAHDDVLAETARRLVEQTEGADEDAARIARGALQKLHTLARQTNPDGPGEGLL